MGCNSWTIEETVHFPQVRFFILLLFTAYFKSKRAIYYSCMKSSLSRKKEEKKRNWVTIVYAFSLHREVIKRTAKASSCVNGCKRKPNCEVFVRRDPSWCLDQVIYRIWPRTYQPFKISRFRKLRTSVFPLLSRASRTYSSFIDSWIYYCRI